MKVSALYLLLFTLLVAATLDASGKKHDKHKHHGPGGRSARHHSQGGRSRLYHDHGHNHGHNHGHGQQGYDQNHDHHHENTHGHHEQHHQRHGNSHHQGFEHGYDQGYEQGFDHQYDHHTSQNQHGRHGHDSYGTGSQRHRRGVINETDHHDPMNETITNTTSDMTLDTSTLEPGRCTKLISVTVTFAQSFQVSRKVQTIVRCGWLHLAKCLVYKIHFETAYRQASRVQYAIVKKCCPGFMEVDGMCRPIGGETTTVAMTNGTIPMTPTPGTTVMMTTTEKIPDDYKVMVDDKIQKLVVAVIIIVLIIFTFCCFGGCLIYVCKKCCNKKAAYV